MAARVTAAIDRCSHSSSASYSYCARRSGLSYSSPDAVAEKDESGPCLSSGHHLSRDKQGITILPHPQNQAQPPLEFIPPNFNSLVFSTVRSLLPFWMRWRIGIHNVQVQRAEVLADLYRQFQAGNNRFMLAFRHPSANDSYPIADLIWHRIPLAARRQGKPLQAPVHAHFIYDRGIPLWAGNLVSWIYARLGGTPIRRGRLDMPGLRSVRDLYANGRFPIAAAPEGATNGHNEIVSPIEPGIAQFGFWCVEDLLKAGRHEPVIIVPIGLRYRFVETPWRSLEKLLTQLEADTLLPDSDADPATPVTLPLSDDALLTQAQVANLYPRLYRLGERLLELMEDFYSKFHGPVFKAAQAQLESEHGLNSAANSDAASASSPHAQLAHRLQVLLQAALTVAEQHFSLQPKGALSDRCRRLEQAGWDRIYREDLKPIETLSPVAQGLADRIAEEANLRLWHMRLVETFVSVTGQYVLEKPTVERFADTLLLLWDTVTRLKGEPPFPRPYIGQQRAQIIVGEPIVVSDRWDDYKANRRQAVDALTQDLQQALEQMVDA